MTQTNGANALATISLQEAIVMLKAYGYSTEGLTEQQIIELAAIIRQELSESQQGAKMEPVKYVINKEACVFVDPLGNSVRELKLTIVHKQITRGIYQKGLKFPICGSLDGITGTMKNENGDVTGTRPCATCPNNVWGTAVNDQTGEKMRGKACKEKRRVWCAENPYTIPKIVSIPPKSIKIFDKYISSRVSQGIPDSAAVTVFRLTPAENDGFQYAIVQCDMGERHDPKTMLQYIQMRERVKQIADSTELTAEEYNMEDDDTVVSNAAAAGTDDKEPF